MIEQMKIRVLPDGRVTRKDAAIFLGVAPGTLANWASRGEGPSLVKTFNKVWYRLADLESFRDASGS